MTDEDKERTLSKEIEQLLFQLRRNQKFLHTEISLLDENRKRVSEHFSKSKTLLSKRQDHINESIRVCKNASTRLGIDENFANIIESFVQLQKSEKSTKFDTGKFLFKANDLRLEGNEVNSDDNLPRAESNVKEEKTRKNKYLKFAPPQKDEELTVVVTMFDSSGHFQGRRAGAFSKMIHQLQLQMTDHYSSGGRGDVLRRPELGSPCVVRRAADRGYHRARLESIRESGDCEVFFVDSGVKETVEAVDILEIAEQFLILPEMAVRGKLAHVIPKSGSKFSEKVTGKIKDKLLGRELTMQVSDVDAPAHSLEAVFYEVAGDVSLCINHWIVLEGDALFGESLPSSGQGMRTGGASMEHRENVPDDNNNTYVCRVLNVVNPSSIFVRKLSDEDHARILREEMEIHYTSSSAKNLCTIQPKPRAMAAVFVPSETGSGAWERCRVLKVIGDRVIVRLLDLGSDFRTYARHLHNLPLAFSMRNFTEEVHLSNVFPCTNSGNWTKTATEFLKIVLKDSNNIVDIQNVGKAGRGSQPVQMFVEVVRGGAAETTELGEALTSQGWASRLVPRPPVSPAPAVAVEDREQYYDPDPDMFDTKEQLHLWPAPPPILQPTVEATASYVDWDGHVYLRPRCHDQRLARVNSELSARYTDSSPGMEDSYWSVGEAAIVKWHIDNNWYRAFVIQVLPNHCRVKIVDYGTESLALFTNMRKRTLQEVEEVPVLCFPLTLAGVQPRGGAWTEEQLTVFHELVVDKVFKVTFEQAGVLCLVQGLFSKTSHLFQLDYETDGSIRCGHLTFSDRDSGDVASILVNKCVVIPSP